MNFTEPRMFGFLWFPTCGRSAPKVGWSTLGLGRYSSLLRTVRSRCYVICIVYVLGSPRCHGQSIERARMVRTQVNSPKGSPVQNNLRYSGQST
jgi:hypothetical protein